MALADSIVSFFNCEDDAANTTVTDSVGTANGTSVNNTSTMSTTGLIDDGFNFNGSTDAVDIDGSGVTGNSWSVSLWFKSTDDTQNGAILFDQYDTGSERTTIRIDNSGNFQYVIYNVATTIDTWSTYADGNWHHCVITTNGFTKKGYIDGVLNFSAATSAYGLSNNLALGQNRILGGNNPYSGDLDLVGIWGKVLTDGSVSVSETAGEEVAELYNSGAGLAYPFSGGGGEAIPEILISGDGLSWSIITN